MDSLTPPSLHPHPYPFNGENLLILQKFLVYAPITGLELSSLACKTVNFTNQNIKQKGDLWN